MRLTKTKTKTKTKIMKVKMKAPIESASGKLHGEAGYHLRTNPRTGQVYTARNPPKGRKPTAKQLAARKAFAERYAGRH